MRSCGIAGQTIMLAAEAMEYDSCPMIGFDASAVAKLINLPEDHVIGFMIAVGKTVKPPWPKPGQLPGQLYNLEDDLGEKRNLHDQHPEVVKKLKRKLAEIKNADR